MRVGHRGAAGRIVRDARSAMQIDTLKPAMPIPQDVVVRPAREPQDTGVGGHTEGLVRSRGSDGWECTADLRWDDSGGRLNVETVDPERMLRAAVRGVLSGRSSMKCPYCGCHDTRVIDSRDTADLSAVRRRRQCVACGKRTTTYERMERPELKVVKRDGQVEDFDRDKLEVGVIKACEKRPIHRDTIIRLLDEMEEALRAEDAHEVSSARIGNLVLQHLKKLDDVAYLRFASVYKAFGNASHFEDELRELKTVRQERLA